MGTSQAVLYHFEGHQCMHSRIQTKNGEEGQDLRWSCMGYQNLHVHIEMCVRLQKCDSVCT